jgi:hypothetical protein
MGVTTYGEPDVVQSMKMDENGYENKIDSCMARNPSFLFVFSSLLSRVINGDRYPFYYNPSRIPFGSCTPQTFASPFAGVPFVSVDNTTRGPSLMGGLNGCLGPLIFRSLDSSTLNSTYNNRSINIAYAFRPSQATRKLGRKGRRMRDIPY